MEAGRPLRVAKQGADTGKMAGKRGGCGEIQKKADKVIAKLENFGPRRFYFQILEF